MVYEIQLSTSNNQQIHYHHNNMNTSSSSASAAVAMSSSSYPTAATTTAGYINMNNSIVLNQSVDPLCLNVPDKSFNHEIYNGIVSANYYNNRMDIVELQESQKNKCRRVYYWTIEQRRK